MEQAPLNYESPGQPSGKDDGPRAGRFVAGLVLGCVVTGLSWLITFQLGGGGYILYVILAVVLAKLIAAVILNYVPRGRPIGTGLVASIAVGFLIFFGTCAYALKNI